MNNQQIESSNVPEIKPFDADYAPKMNKKGQKKQANQIESQRVDELFGRAADRISTNIMNGVDGSPADSNVRDDTLWDMEQGNNDQNMLKVDKEWTNRNKVIMSDVSMYLTKDQMVKRDRMLEEQKKEEEDEQQIQVTKRQRKTINNLDSNIIIKISDAKLNDGDDAQINENKNVFRSPNINKEKLNKAKNQTQVKETESKKRGNSLFKGNNQKEPQSKNDADVDDNKP